MFKTHILCEAILWSMLYIYIYTMLCVVMKMMMLFARNSLGSFPIPCLSMTFSMTGLPLENWTITRIKS